MPVVTSQRVCFSKDEKIEVVKAIKLGRLASIMVAPWSAGVKSF